MKWDLLYVNRYILREVSLDTVKLYFALKYFESNESYEKWRNGVLPSMVLVSDKAQYEGKELLCQLFLSEESLREKEK